MHQTLPNLKPFWLCISIRSTSIQCLQFVYRPNFLLIFHPMLDPNHILLLKVSQIVGPPTFLWDWQKFAFCQSYVRQKIWGIREICICIFFLNFLFEVVYNQYIFKMYWLNHFWIKKTSSIFVMFCRSFY